MAVWKLPEGRWAARFRTPTGERPYKVFDSKAEAEDWEHESRKASRQGHFVSEREMPSFEEVATQWLETKKGHEAASYEYWERQLRLHLIPLIGDAKVGLLTAELVEKKVVGPLSRSSVKKSLGKVLTTGAAAYAYAMRSQPGLSNPFSLAVRPRVKREEEDEEVVAEDSVYSPTQLQKILAEASSGKPRTLLMTAAFTGARHSEILALGWDHVDLDAGLIHIRRTLTRAKGADGAKGWKFKKPKTKTGVRTIPIPAELVKEIRRWKLACPKNDAHLVFPGDDGQPLQRQMGVRWLERAAKAAGEPALDIKALRHSFASIQITILKKTAPEVAFLLGHATPLVTMKIYAHFIRSVGSTATQDMASLVFGKEAK